MNCFNHHTDAAIAICKSCGKGVCPSCAIDKGFAVTCSESCADEASDTFIMSSRAKRMYGLGGAKKVFPLGVVIWMVFGLLFSSFGIYRFAESGTPEWFLLLFGAASFFLAFATYRRAKSLELNC
ncbi:hypothetical protein A9179_01590 [Pseudomonas alcaligenes]|uniref:B box-type domain-containing protein n=1 Tax=Aquipseudomonas alcaligenes TaxID=43263 RepID=A0ABR7RXK5_AQUAC|nr:hypothetical protein [Pseudomonas alcaligenes]MBC9248958.1 hypothetical protein [Pseudomonas alcaligenes]